MVSGFLSPLTFHLYPTSLQILHLLQDVSLPFTLPLPQRKVDKIPVICDKSRVSFYIIRKLNYLFK